jgi:hypothetical protein
MEGLMEESPGFGSGLSPLMAPWVVSPRIGGSRSDLTPEQEQKGGHDRRPEHHLVIPSRLRQLQGLNPVKDWS